MAEMTDPYASFRDKYDVHPECYEHLKFGLSVGVIPYHLLTPEQARAQGERIGKSITFNVDFQGSEKDILVPSPHSTEGIPVTVYKPDSCPSVPAIMIYFHGGGLVIGSRNTHSRAVKSLSRESGAIVLNVEYRLLPQETAKLAPFEDAVVVAQWVLANKAAVGGHPESKVGVGGDSAGGQLAIAVTNELPGQMDFQALVYPLTDASMTQKSVKEFIGTPGLPATAIEWFFKNSVAQIPDYENNPTVNPAVRTNLPTSPPAMIVVAELDALRDMGLEYADKLKASGVPVECHLIKGVPHAFFSLPHVFKTKTAEAYGHIASFLKKYQ